MKTPTKTGRYQTPTAEFRFKEGSARSFCNRANLINRMLCECQVLIDLQLVDVTLNLGEPILRPETCIACGTNSYLMDDVEAIIFPAAPCRRPKCRCKVRSASSYACRSRAPSLPFPLRKVFYRRATASIAVVTACCSWFSMISVAAAHR